MKQIKVNNNVFWFNVFWFIWDRQEFVDYMLKNWFDWNRLEWTDGITYIRNNNAFLYLNAVCDYVLLHECIHIIQDILNNKLISTWIENTEVLAYNVDWLYRQLLLRYYKWKWNEKWKSYK